MKYYKRVWEETIGEELTNSWGTSTYYFETDEDGNVVRQVQVFENGNGLKYGENFLQDEYGGLAEKTLDLAEFESHTIDQLEFEKVWAVEYNKA